MLAPEPFFEPRGTPFSEYHRIKALGELGHQVDLVTYPIGRDVALPGLTIYRSLRPPFVSKVRIGPSVTKLVLDALMLVTILRRVLGTRYDAIHSHEEMGLVGVWLAKILRIPHLYDMHSSLPQQLSNFKYSKSGALRGAFNWAEDQMVFGSDVVITICQELQDTVARMGVGGKALLIENVMGGDVEEPPSMTPDQIRQTWGIAPDAPLMLYTGTFEAYQGLELLHDERRPAGAHPPAGARARRRRRAGAGRGRPTGSGQARRRPDRRLHRAAACPRDPRVRGGVRHSRVAADSRHQYAAEDLFLPAVRQADRRDGSAHAHAGAVGGEFAAAGGESGSVCGGGRRADRSTRGAGSGWRRPQRRWRRSATAASRTSAGRPKRTGA